MTTLRDRVAAEVPPGDAIEKIVHERTRTPEVSPTAEPVGKDVFMSFSEIPEGRTFNTWDSAIVITNKNVVSIEPGGVEVSSRGIVGRIASLLR